MNFDIASTPTLQAVATQDEQLLAQDLQSRVEEAITQVDGQPEVVEAAEAHRVAGERLARMRKAERVLNQYSKQARDQMTAISQAALDAIIDTAASAGEPEFGKLKALAEIENRTRFASRAIQRIVEHLIPLAQIAALREESHALMTKARATERTAQDRAEKVLGQLRDAVTEEVVLPVDMSKGVAGALLAHAAGLKRCALQLSEEADQIERSYQEMTR
jgi:hypothetical protein